MNRFAAALVASLLGIVSPAHAEDFEVTVFSLEELSQAITDANARPAGTHTIIRAQGRMMTSPEVSLPAIRSRVTLSAYFHGVDGKGPNRLLYIDQGANVVLNLQVVDFQIGRGDVSGFIENHGRLTLRGEFRLVRSETICVRTGCAPVGEVPVVFNAQSAQIDISGVTFRESGYPDPYSNNYEGEILRNLGQANLVRVQVYQPDKAWSSPLFNSGTLRMQNVSFVTQPRRHQERNAVVRATDSAVTESVNSVFGGFSGEWCRSVTSLGHNISDSADCDWSEEGDLVGTPAGLIWRDAPDLSSARALEYALVPTRVSAAVDSADPNWCTISNVADGNGDGVSVCDRGAVELLPFGLENGGINGLYYNPDADGHYIQILQTDFVTLVVWNTFDRDGNQAWVFGTGELVDGRSVVADTYINVNGGADPNGDYTASEPVRWGRIEVDMESCTRGVVAYYSDYPGFGTGEFPIERLGYVKQLGCVD